MEKDNLNTTTASYLWGANLDELVRFTKNAETLFAFQDGLGSVTGLAQGKQLKETYSYSSFGEPTIKDRAGNILLESAYSNDYLFTGRELDPETGLYNYRAREYSPEVGRFLQEDPLTWGPEDRRALEKSTNLSEIISDVLGINTRSEVEKKRVEQEFLLDNQFMPSSDYFANSRPWLNLNSEVIKSAVLDFGQLNPQLFSPYIYTHNNPINYIDPDGEFVPLTLFWWAAAITLVTVIANQLYWAVKGGKIPPAPGPAQEPYQPLNPMSQGPTGLAPCGK